MSLNLALNFEKALRLLTEHLPPSDETSRKPILFHNIRVGVYLYESGYEPNIILAGLLHDTIEWSSADERILRNEFGDEVVKIILACTKDDSITDKEEKTNELINRCIKNGQTALIVKTADIIDSFKWYSYQNNQNELEYCLRNANAILKFKPDDFDDKIFGELKNWEDKFKK